MNKLNDKKKNDKIENVTQLKYALDKLTEQKFMNHSLIDNGETVRFINNGLKAEIKAINSLNPDKEEQKEYTEKLSKVLSLNIDGHIKLLNEVIDNLLFPLMYKTEGIYEAMNRLLPFDSNNITN